MEIGKRLKIARKTIGYTLEKVEQESGGLIGRSSLSNFENEKREPSFSQLSKLADIYKRGITFFLSDDIPAEALPLWRDPPTIDEERKETEAIFRQLCEQYHRLEVCCGEVKRPRLPAIDVARPEDLTYRHVNSFARKVREQFALGDTPGPCLKTRLEETYYVKIFYLDFNGSAISSFSEVFGPAILLNRTSKPWRRTFDLAHEVFHILTWRPFRERENKDHIPGPDEEKLANTFASVLLIPEESLRERLDSYTDSDGNLRLHHLDDISREYDVSLDALICRIASMFRFRKEETERYRDLGKKYLTSFKTRSSYEPQKYPERYCELAVRALRGGRLSLMQFAKYMNLSYKKAQEYLKEDDEFTDEKISIPAT